VGAIPPRVFFEGGRVFKPSSVAHPIRSGARKADDASLLACVRLESRQRFVADFYDTINSPADGIVTVRSLARLASMRR